MEGRFPPPPAPCFSLLYKGGKNPCFFGAVKENASMRDRNRSLMLTLLFLDFSFRYSHDGPLPIKFLGEFVDYVLIRTNFYLRPSPSFFLYILS